MQISSSVAVDENYLSPGSDQELLFVNRADRTSHDNFADVRSSSEEEGTAATLWGVRQLAVAVLQLRNREN